ncbi:immunoglobulin-like domain-containing protein [Haloplasma contractile]|uniref:Serine-rich adhesin for platelet protein n=1 Tax=Haloplasma contractile SSD-17B TaxID=1033810 RepID=U2DRD5_9MOLU|nr:immunoglobulin-like domain-containing protein [Haloplasma contractile]ERJ11137.1 Serine-rich adhesin for platelet protein [Haloplasma contractile SSD-17B]
MTIKQNVLNKRNLISIFMLVFMFILFIIVNPVVSKAEGLIYFVNPDKAYEQDTFGTIEEAIVAASDGDTIHIAPGTYKVPNLEITKSLTIRGDTSGDITLIPTEDTGTGNGWITISRDLDVTILNLIFDGSGTDYDLYYGIHSHSYIHVIDSQFKGITYGTGYGAAIVLTNGGYVSDNSFSDIGRVGLQVMGETVQDSGVINNTFKGKGEGNHLDYGVRVETEVSVVIKGNTISGYSGKKEHTTQTSAGIVVSSLFGTIPTQVRINERNKITDNQIGILVGESDQDNGSVVVASGNIIKNNVRAIVTNGTHDVDARYNFFNTGLKRPTVIDEDVTYFPWAIDETFEQFTNHSIEKIVIDDDFSNLNQYDHVSVDTNNDGTVEDYYFGFNAFKTLENATLQSRESEALTNTKSSTLFVLPGTYHLKNTLTIDKGISIIGTAVEDVMIDASEVSVGIEITNMNTEQVLLKNVTVKGKGLSETGILVDKTDGLIVRNLTIDGFSKAGLNLNSATNVELSSVTTSNNITGIQLVDSKNVSLSDITSNTNSSGIRIVSTHDNNQGFDGINLNSVIGVIDGIYIEDQHRENLKLTTYSVLDNEADVTFNSPNINYAYYGIKKETNAHHIKFFNSLEESLLMTNLAAFDHVYVSDLHKEHFIVTEALSIDKAVDSAKDGDSIIIYPGAHTIDKTLNIDQAITITGNGSVQEPVILNYKGEVGEAILITSSNVTLEGLTLNASNMTSHVIKAIGSVTDGTKITNLNLNNLIIKSASSGLSGVLFDGIKDSNINELTITNSGGTGIELIDSNTITIDHITTSENLQGGIRIQTNGIIFDGNSDSITVSNIDAISELKQVIVIESLNEIQNLLLPETLTHRIDAGNFTYYSNSLTNAFTVAEERVSVYKDVTVKKVNEHSYYVSTALSIQAALDVSSLGDTVNLTEGTHVVNTPLRISKGIHLKGSGIDVTQLEAGTEVSHAIIIGDSNIEMIEISAFTLLGSQTNTYGIFADKTIKLNLHDLVIKQFTDSGIYLNNTSNTRIERVELSQNTGTGLTLVNPMNLNINTLTTTGNGLGVFIKSKEQTDLQAIDNVVLGDTLTIVDGIKLQEHHASRVSYSLSKDDNADITLLSNLYSFVYQGVTSEGITETFFISSRAEAFDLTNTNDHTHLFVKDILNDSYYINKQVSLLKAIEYADHYDTIYLTEGNYSLEHTLIIEKPLTLTGAGKDLVTLNSSIIDGNGILINSSDVTLSNFTFNTPSIQSYPIKVESEVVDQTITKTEHVTIEHLIVNNNGNSGKTGIVISGINYATIQDVTITHSGDGNGLSITDSSGITLKNITTKANSKGGIAIYATGAHQTSGTDAILIEGDLQLNELNKIYLVESNGYRVSNLTLPTTYQIMIRDGAKTYYQPTLKDAFALVETAFNTNQYQLETHITIYSEDDHAFYVINGLSIQHAIDQAIGGETIYIYPGNYNESTQIKIDETTSHFTGLIINKDNLSLIGVDIDGNPITGSGDVMATVQVDASVSDPFLVTGDHVLIQGLELIAQKESEDAIINYVVKITGNDVTIQNSVIDGDKGLFYNSIIITDVQLTNGTVDGFVSTISHFNINNNSLYGSVTIDEGVGYNVLDSEFLITSNQFKDSLQAKTQSSGIIHGREQERLLAQLPLIKNNTFNSNADTTFVSFRDSVSLTYIQSFVSENQFKSYAYLIKSHNDTQVIKPITYNSQSKTVIWNSQEDTVAFMNVDDLVVYYTGDEEVQKKAGALKMPGYNGIPALLSDHTKMVINVEPNFPDIEGLDIYVKINDGNFEPYSNYDYSLEFNQEGMSEIIFKTIDADSHEHIMNKLTIKIDQTPPKLEGVFDLYVDVFSEDIDFLQGVHATDLLSKTKGIVVDDTKLDLSHVGIYNIIYSVSDDVGNVTEQTVSVHVEDHVAPTINKQNGVFEVGLQVVNWDDYFTISDNYDEIDDIDVATDTSKVNFKKVGTYVVTITATDQSENTTTSSFTVTVQDTIAPTISGVISSYEVKSARPIWSELFDLADNYDESIDLSFEVEDSGVDMNSIGTYEITVTVTDTSGNQMTQTYDVEVNDTTAPIIEVEDLDYILNSEIPNWPELIGISDNYYDRSELTIDIDADDVDMAVVGNYDVHVTVTDDSGNESTKTFKVAVIDDIAPTVSIEDHTFEVLTNAPIWSVLIEAMDNYDQAEDLVIVINANEVKMDTVGTYTVYVTVTDTSGNSTDTSFIVTIEDTIAPTFSGVKDRTVRVGVNAFDPLEGITANDTNDGELTEHIEISGDYDLGKHGDYTLTLKVKDESGNEKTTTYTLTVDDPNKGIKPSVIIGIAVGSILIVGAALVLPKLGKK